MIIGAVSVLVVLAIAVPVFAFMYAVHSSPSSWWGGGGRSFGGDVPMFDRYSLMWMGGAFFLGAALGARYARRWWSTLAFYAVGLTIWLAIMPSSNLGGDVYSSVGDIYALPFWIFGVSAGAGVRGRIQSGRLRTSTVLAGIPLLAGIVSAVVLASEKRPRWPGYRGPNETFYVTPWWGYVGSVGFGLLGVALAVLIYGGTPRWLERHLRG